MTVHHDCLLPSLVPPLTNTTSTAAYAAQAAKISGLLAFVNRNTHAANAVVYTTINLNFTCERDT